jgi:lipopolysaccharide/colanic/teichoic acid biosynthesis glycosyltransferase
MSIVGPRPLVPGGVEMHQEAWCRRVSVFPGSKGHWRVCGRDDLSAEAAIRLCLDDFQNRSIWSDLRIATMAGKEWRLGKRFRANSQCRARASRLLSVE